MATEGMNRIQKAYLQKIAKRLEEIGRHVWSEQTPIEDVAAAETMDHLTVAQAKKLKYKPVGPGFRWGEPWSTAWFRVRVAVPKSLAGQTVAVVMPTQGECIIFRDGKPVQGLDRNRSEYVLFDKARGGERVELYVEAGASDSFGGFQKRETGPFAVGVFLDEVWQCFNDLCVILDLLKPFTAWSPDGGNVGASLAVDDPWWGQLLFGANKAVDLFDYLDTSRGALIASAKRVRKALRPLLAHRATDSAQTIACMGHAHIDVAWLWPLAETKRKCGRTFSNVLSLMDRYREFIFCQSQPHLYEFTRDRYSSLWRRIKQKVKAGQWVPTGAAWVEMDCNITGAESLVRQMLFGTRFWKDEFNHAATCLWLPDVFGYSAALPQILKRSGVPHFLTQKISWNLVTKFPHHSFHWEGIDGTRVLSHFLPTDSYNALMTAGEVCYAARNYRQKDRSGIQASLFGFGDGGGGPIAKMLETRRRLEDFEGTPKCVPMGPTEFFRRLADESTDLPVWVGELYLEMHRGTLTTQSRVKRYNRQCELTLRQAECLGAMTLPFGGKVRQADLNAAWKLVLLNQFHDVIPGSSITKVYEDSWRQYGEALATAAACRDASMKTYASKVDTRGEGAAIVAFNSLSWDRDAVVECSVKGLPNPVAVAADGAIVPVQKGADGVGRFIGRLPAMGHAVFHLRPGKAPELPVVSATKTSLENDRVRVKIDAKGRITSLVDKATRREAVARGGAANELVLYEDKPNSYDAWDIEVFYRDKPLVTDGEVVSIDVIEQGPVRAVVRIVKTISKSTITQDVVLTAGSPRVDVVNTVDWGDEKDVLLRANFAMNVRSDHARYEIQFGNVERPTHENRPHDLAQFEVAAQKWADLSEGDFGVAVLNTCKYGHNVRGNVMGLSLLRAPKYPDPAADVNQRHEFTYSLLAHEGGYTNGVVRSAYELNVPVQAVAAPASKGTLPPVASQMTVTGENVVIETVKKAEDDGAVIVRLYEAHGSRGKRTFRTSMPVKRIVECDLMEHEEKVLADKTGRVSLDLKPFQIRTLKLVL